MTVYEPQTFIGCISGTSVDGLDVAALDIWPDGSMQSRYAETYPLPDTLRDELLRLGQPGDNEIDRLGTADRRLGDFIGRTLNNFIRHHMLHPRAIGSHGQTVRHRPDPQSGFFTLQIGDANQIAELTGIDTIADFRRRDMAAGGQGAPLVPPFHQAMFAGRSDAAVALNVGGISNVSILAEPLSGYDTGPGNGLLDAWCMQHQGRPFDEDGAWAASGHIDQRLLNQLLGDPYFSQAAPKSTGREYFNLAWLIPQLADSALTPADVQATLTELTARCTTDALARDGIRYKDLIVCGGGRLNGFLMQRLAANTSARVSASEAFEVDGDAIEAALFAWLAYRTINRLPGNATGVTGAAAPRVLGAIYPGAAKV